MRAIVVSEHGGPEVLELRDQPSPEAGPGRVLVGVETAGVNYRDVYERVGGGYSPGAPPFVAGVEGAGTVREVGEGVATIAVGDRVAWVAGQGSYAEQVAIDADAAVPVPDGVSTEDAAAVLLQGMTAQYLAASTYPVAEGDTVVVHAAAGGVGLLLTQIVKLRGAYVIATTSTPEKAALAREAGADEVIGYDELRDDTGAAVVYDGVGKATFDRSLAALRPRGIMVLYGAASGQPDPVAPATLAAKSLFLTRPSLPAHIADRAELLARADDVFGWLAAGKLSVRIGARYALEDARHSHEDLEARRSTGKLVLQIT